MVDGMLRFPWPRQQPAVVWDTWMHAYHGTRAENSCSIIWQGGMKPPSEAGVLVVHGQRGSFNKRSIYVTPARGLAEHPLYSKLSPLDDQHYGQLVLELRVDPTAIASTQESTLGGNQHWRRELRIDQAFQNQDGLEWLLQDADGVVIVAILFRCIGPSAGQYGRLNQQVKHEWVKLPNGQRSRLPLDAAEADYF